MMSITIEFEDGSEEVVHNVDSFARQEDGAISLTRDIRGIDNTSDEDREQLEFDHGVITYITTEGYV
jgi:hypothetical protein